MFMQSKLRWGFVTLVTIVIGGLAGHFAGLFVGSLLVGERTVEVLRDTVYICDTVRTVLYRDAENAPLTPLAEEVHRGGDTVRFYHDIRRDSVAEVEIFDSVSSRGFLRWREVRVGCFLRERNVLQVERVGSVGWASPLGSFTPLFQERTSHTAMGLHHYVGGYYAGSDAWGAMAGVRWRRYSVGVIADAPRQSVGGMVLVEW